MSPAGCYGGAAPARMDIGWPIWSLSTSFLALLSQLASDSKARPCLLSYNTVCTKCGRVPGTWQGCIEGLPGRGLAWGPPVLGWGCRNGHARTDGRPLACWLCCVPLEAPCSFAWWRHPIYSLQGQTTQKDGSCMGPCPTRAWSVKHSERLEGLPHSQS